jgi:hypothetical protein
MRRSRRRNGLLTTARDQAERQRAQIVCRTRGR